MVSFIPIQSGRNSSVRDRSPNTIFLAVFVDDSIRTGVVDDLGLVDRRLETDRHFDTKFGSPFQFHNYLAVAGVDQSAALVVAAGLLAVV